MKRKPKPLASATDAELARALLAFAKANRRHPGLAKSARALAAKVRALPADDVVEPGYGGPERPDYVSPTPEAPTPEPAPAPPKPNPEAAIQGTGFGTFDPKAEGLVERHGRWVKPAAPEPRDFAIGSTTVGGLSLGGGLYRKY